MWEAAPLGMFSRRYAVTERNRPVAEIAFGRWREHSSITFGDRRLTVRSEGWWRPKLKLEERGELRSCATSRGALRSGFTFAFGDDEYELYQVGVFSRSFELSLEKRPLGRVSALGVFSRRVSIQLDEDLPPEVRLFALWLTLIAWHRAAAAAAAS